MRRRRSLWVVVLSVALVVLVVSLVALALIGLSYHQGQQKYAHLSEHVSGFEVADAQLDAAQVDWESLFAVNPDTVAWLYIPGTNVNYPVAQGEDNEYYLVHDFTGEAGWLAEYGSVFMDWRNAPDWSDEAYFLYGHHMNDGSMFADIAKMADQTRFDSSRTVYVLSPSGNFRLRSFSLLHCAADDPLVQIDFANSQDMAAYVQDKIDRSIVAVGEIPEPGQMDKIFAFATCDDFSAGRYVLFAYVEEEGSGGPVGFTAATP